jgi:hypothetical protein
LQGGCTDSDDGTVEAITVCCPEVIDALRQAIEQAQQAEPVAWYDSKSGWTEFHSFKPVRKPSAPDAEWLPLYTAPPKRDLTCVCGAVWEGETMVHAPHQRKPLTYPQIHELDWPDGVAFEEILLFVRAIEAAHGITGGIK